MVLPRHLPAHSRLQTRDVPPGVRARPSEGGVAGVQMGQMRDLVAPSEQPRQRGRASRRPGLEKARKLIN